MATLSYFGPSRPVTDDLSLAFLFQSGDQYYEFVPRSVFEKGVVKDKTQYYLPDVLRPDFYGGLESNASYIDVNDLANVYGKKVAEDLKKQGYQDQYGYLFPMTPTEQGLSSWMDANTKVQTYKIGEETQGAGGATYTLGKIEGLGTLKDGQRAFSTDTSGTAQNSQGWIQYNPESNTGQIMTSYYDPPSKSNKLALAIGYGLIGAGTLGLAGVGPLAGGTAAGTGAGAGAAGGGIVGTPGVSTIFPVAAPTAPTVSTIAPIATATAVPAAQLAYPGLEVAPTFTPAPDSLQAALPSLGVETAASAAPFTAAPGSFQAALPALGIATSPSLATNLASSGSGISTTDVLRAARGLLGAGQNPVVPQGMPRQQAGQRGAVDYSGVLGLLQQQARTPGVSSLTAPAQLMPRYQPTLLPNITSLLG